MSRPQDRTNPDRLMAAVDAVLQADAELVANFGRSGPKVVATLGTANMPDCLLGFSFEEICDAAKMAERLGLIIKPA